MSLWGDTGATRSSFGGARGTAHLEAAERLKEWTRERFALSADDVVLVSESPCTDPGFPPMQTVVAFWSEGNATRHHYRVFKRLEAVEASDVPPAWMKRALANADFQCECC